MKQKVKYVIFLGVIVLMITGRVTITNALPLYSFNSHALINPNINNTWDPVTLTGVANIYLYVDDVNVNVNEFNIYLESDIFNLDKIAATDFTVISPSTGWDTEVWENPGDPTLSKWSISYTDDNFVNASNDPLIVQFTYTLIDANVYYYSTNWEEGQVWALKYDVIGQFDSGSLAVSGGSTAPVPEPATIMLMGAGLVGFSGFVRRKRRSKRN